jgi:hypothetical protein
MQRALRTQAYAACVCRPLCFCSIHKTDAIVGNVMTPRTKFEVSWNNVVQRLGGSGGSTQLGCLEAASDESWYFDDGRRVLRVSRQIGGPVRIAIVD